MSKSATDVMQDIVFAAVVDSIVALKAASRGVPNTLLRDLNAVHANTTFADMPAELQAAITASVRAAFTRLLREGYSVAPASAAPPRPPRPSPELVNRARDRRPPPRRDPSDNRPPPRKGPRPDRKPRPR